jgi:hypothetical protein
MARFNATKFEISCFTIAVVVVWETNFRIMKIVLKFHSTRHYYQNVRCILVCQ